MKLHPKDLTRNGVMVALIAIGAFIKIPSPVVGCFTLQLAFVILAGIILGSKNGMIAASIYVIGGLLGIPWFVLGGGIGYVLQPTFGFLLSFILATYIAGLAKNVKQNKLVMTIITSIIATVFVWVIGMIYLSCIYQYYLGKNFGFIAAIVSIFSLEFFIDIALAVITSIVGVKISKEVSR